MIFITAAHRGTSFAVIYDGEFALHGTYEDAQQDAGELALEQRVSIMDLTVSTAQLSEEKEVRKG